MANEYPTPFYSGPPIMSYQKLPKDYREFTITAKFEDGGVDSTTTGADVAQRWTVRYEGLTQTQAKVVLDPYNTNKLSATFTFKEPRDDPWSGATGNTVTGVQYESPVEQPEHKRVWGQSLVVHLIKYPA